MTTQRAPSLLPHLPPPFVGDLSTRDALILTRLAANHRVLEHGAGGSTQIFALVAALVVSVEPDDTWRTVTKTNLERLREGGYVTRAPEFVADLIGGLPRLQARAPYDLAFVDGPSTERDAFAHLAFPLLAPGGRLVFHDTRVAHEHARALRLVETFAPHVESVAFHPNGSNLTIVCRLPTGGQPAHYSDWNLDEGREEWEIGRGDPPPRWIQYVIARSARVLGVPLDPAPADPDPKPEL